MLCALAKTEEAAAGEELDCGVGKEKEPKIVLFVLWSVLSFCCLSDGEGTCGQG